MREQMQEPLASDSGATRAAILIASVILLIACSGLLWWLFRTEESDHQLGLISYRYSWGRLTEMSIDSNRDGVTDARMLVLSHDNRPGSTNFDMIEGWEALQLNGVFDIHYGKEAESGEFFLERDLNGDGVYDERYTGQEAKDVLEGLRSSDSDIQPEPGETF